MTDHLSDPLDLGPCCACGRHDDTVRNIALLDRRAPVPGTGWGCLSCGLPPNGALALLCDECLSQNRPLIFAVRGFLADRQRILLSELRDPYLHDEAKHALALAENPGLFAPNQIPAAWWDTTTWPHHLN